MRVKLDKTICIGCGLCEENVPEIFRTGEYTAELKTDEIDDELVQQVRETTEDCPAGAVTIS
jgi:ferredoxin